jgi:5'(3')-deoxyribonucleotidase
MATCLLDMDGVIVDLHTILYTMHGINDPAEQREWNNHQRVMSEEECWADTDEAWWAALPWMPDGKQILKLLEARFGPKNIVLCTTPGPMPGSCEGKLAWIKRHMPDYTRRYMLTTNKTWAASASSVLIDDTDKNIDAFNKAGGIAIQVPRPWNRLHSRADHAIDFLNTHLTFNFGEPL